MKQPNIAILIPCYNEELVICATINALDRAGCGRQDIYIVDDRSTDKTAVLAASSGVNVFTVHENGGKARAQAAALEHFKLLDNYDWIIFLDGDTKVDENFMTEMTAAAIRDPSVALYVGQVKSVKNNHIFSASRAYDYTYGQDVAKQGQSNFNVIFVSPGCASMYRASALAKLHIDHLTLAEDMDLTMQVHRIGGRVEYISRAIVNTQDPNNFKDYHKQILRWYRGYWQVVLKHRIFGLQHKQRVDWYMMMLTVDAILYNRALWLIGIFAFNALILPEIFALDLATSAIVAAYCSFRTRRWDVLYKFPVYYWISYMNFYAYLRAFFEIVLLRKEILAWNKVARYEFNDNHLL